MLLAALREQVLEANLELVRRGLVLYTFGNVSGISRKDGLVAIKPSGVPYDDLTPEHIVISDLQGKIVEGDFRPSSDLPTHVELYRSFPSIGALPTPTPSSLLPGHRRSVLFRAWAQLMPTIFTARSR